MIRRRACRRAISVALAASALVAAGCGGNGSSDPKADQAYYASLNSFCSTVVSAAGHVTSVTTRLQTHPPRARRQIFDAIATTLTDYATAMEKALTQLKATKVPSKFSAFNQQTTAAFVTLAAKLRTAAVGARAGDEKTLTSLGATLDAVKGPPNPPKEILRNVTACPATAF